jgi:hypothetical protein
MILVNPSQRITRLLEVAQLLRRVPDLSDGRRGGGRRGEEPRRRRPRLSAPLIARRFRPAQRSQRTSDKLPSLRWMRGVKPASSAGITAKLRLTNSDT